MDDRHFPSGERPAKEAFHGQPSTPVSPEAGATHGTQSGAVRVYDRPESDAYLWTPGMTTLLVIALILAVLAIYFFVL
jgi:hypothetical protein